MANYSFGIHSIPVVENGHTFKGDNFLQLLPHTRICEGVTGLKFINCNLTNCDIPLDATHEGGTPYHVEWCSNVHPKWVDHGLTPCATVCPHVVSVDKITIDSVVVDQVYYYEDKVVV